MKEYHTKMINISLFICVFLLHGFFGLLPLDLDLSFKRKKISINLKSEHPKVRKVGLKDSKYKNYEIAPSKASKPSLKNFAVTPNQGVDKVKNRRSAIDKKRAKKQQEKKDVAKINFVQKQIVNEAISEKRVENPLLNEMNYNVKFVPPKGIKMEELNEFEKVFYAFFKRVALQYIDSINSTVISTVDDKPYVEGILKSHKPKTLTAMVRYDDKGNAEVIKILQSSYSDEVHALFETALKKMDKIPNIAKKLRDKDGKYTAFFQLGINSAPRL